MVSVNNTRRPSSTTQAQEAPPSTSTQATDNDDGVEDIEDLSLSAPLDSAYVVVKNVSDAMGGFIVTDSEATNAVAQLKALPPAQAKEALETLALLGSLDKLANEVPAAARKDLVDVMIRSGFVGSEAGKVYGGGDKPKAPDAPVFAKHNNGLSKAVTELLHDENMSRLDGFREAFGAYKSAYQQAVRDVKSHAELRALGPIAEPRIQSPEPGAASNDTWFRKSQTAVDTDTAKMVTDKLFRLNGQSPPGADFYFDVTLKTAFLQGKVTATEDRSGKRVTERSVSVTPGAVQVTVGDRTEDGKTTTKPTQVKVAAKAIAGDTSAHFNVDEQSIEFGASHGTKERGATGGSLKLGDKEKAGSVSLRDVAGAKFKVAEDEISAEVSGGGAKLGASQKTTIDEQGHVRTTAKATIGADNVAGTAGIDSDGGIIAGVSVDADLVSLEFETTVQLLTKKDYAAAFAQIEGTPFETPPELLRGKKWNTLNPSQQAAYKLFGWNEKSWGAQQKSTAGIQAARIGGR